MIGTVFCNISIWKSFFEDDEISCLISSLAATNWIRPWWFIPSSRNQLYEAAAQTVSNCLFWLVSTALGRHSQSTTHLMLGFVGIASIHWFVNRHLENWVPCKAVQVRLPGELVARANRAVASSTITGCGSQARTHGSFVHMLNTRGDRDSNAVSDALLTWGPTAIMASIVRHPGVYIKWHEGSK